MQFLDVFRAMVCALRTPWRLHAFVDRRATTFFAVAVLSVTAVNVGATMLTADDPHLVRENMALTPTMEVGKEHVDLSQPQRQFTAVLGGAVFVSSVSILVLSGLMMAIGRFLTDRPFRFGHAVIVTSSASSIVILRVIVETALQLSTHSVRWGPHAGIMVDPAASPHWFAALQRIDLFGLWEYIVVATGLVATQELHHRYGYVVGPVVWAVTIMLFGGATAIASLLAGSV